MSARFSIQLGGGLVLLMLMFGCASGRLVPWPLKIVETTVETADYHAELALSSAAMSPCVAGELLYCDLIFTVKNKGGRDLYFSMGDVVIVTAENRNIAKGDASLSKPSGIEMYRIRRGSILQLELRASSVLTELYSFYGIEFGDLAKQGQYAEMYRALYPERIDKE